MTLAPIARALERMDEIMAETSVVAMRGEAYNDNDTDRLKRAAESLRQIDPEPYSFVAMTMNRKLMDDVLRGVETAQYMLNRIGFEEVKGIAFLDRDQRIVDEGYEAALQMAGRGRS